MKPDQLETPTERLQIAQRDDTRTLRSAELSSEPTRCRGLPVSADYPVPDSVDEALTAQDGLPVLCDEELFESALTDAKYQVSSKREIRASS